MRVARQSPDAARSDFRTSSIEPPPQSRHPQGWAAGVVLLDPLRASRRQARRVAQHARLSPRGRLGAGARDWLIRRQRSDCTTGARRPTKPLIRALGASLGMKRHARSSRISFSPAATHLFGSSTTVMPRRRATQDGRDSCSAAISKDDAGRYRQRTRESRIQLADRAAT